MDEKELKKEEKEEIKKKILLDAFPEDPADGDNVCISCQ